MRLDFMDHGTRYIIHNIFINNTLYTIKYYLWTLIQFDNIYDKNM